MFISITQMVLPVLASIFIGWLFKKKGVLGEDGVDSIKKVITYVTLPVVLFRAFLTAEYNMNVFVVFCIIFVCCTIALVAGYLLRPLAGKYSKFMPFLLTGFEAGMLGYALFALLVGTEGLSTMAMVDIGQTIFVYTVYLALLKASDGKKASAKELLVNMLTAPPFVGVLLGIALGISGIGGIIISSEAGGILMDLIDFLAAPTACLILISMGYQLSFKKSLIKPVLITAFVRLALMAVLFASASLVLFRFVPESRELRLAMMVMFSLPAPFIIPLFADLGEDGEYVSTTYSVGTLLTICCFVGIAAYSMA